MNQKIIVSALPNGFIVKNGITHLKVSAALSLQVENANTTLQQVPDMLQWASLVKQAKFIVQYNNVPVTAAITSATPDETLWKTLFTPTVKVKSFVQEDLTTLPVASYPVKHIVSHLKNIISLVGKDFANDLPDSNFYTNNPLFTSLSEYGVAEFPKRGREKITLDRIVQNRSVQQRIQSQLRQQKAIPFNPNPNPQFDFTQLKNFHGLYDKKPVATFQQVPKPDFEFHDILSVLSSYPPLMRRLGLVFDLEFPAPQNILLLPGTEPSIRIILSGINYSLPTTITCPATAFTLTTKGFYSKAAPGSMIDKGYLKINTEAFTVFQIDTDGAALKMCQMMDSLQLKKAKHIFYAAEAMLPDASAMPFFNNEAPRKEGITSNRSAGIAIARNGLAEMLQKKFVKQQGMKISLMTPGAAPSGLSGNNANFILPNTLLYADDTVMGYRMDVQPEGLQGKWFSLHRRVNQYAFINPAGTAVPIPGLGADEGFIQAGASEENTSSGKQLKVGEVIARWEGWSLSVPRPGSALNDPLLDNKEVYDKNNPAEKQKEESKYKTPATADFKLNVTPAIEKGSLPMLRFGKKYAIKIRTVDLAGNSPETNSMPENASETVMANIRYMRYEPVDAPFLMLGNKIKDGESSEVMVIRSAEELPAADFESSVGSGQYKPEAVRHVKPPRCTVEMAILHGMLDKGFGPAQAAQAKTFYQKITAEKDPLFSEDKNSPDLKVFDPDQQMLEVEYLADPLAAGVTFFISANDPNPKVPNPEIFTRRVSFYFNEEVTTDAIANKTISTEEWFQPKTFRILLKEGAPAINWDASSRTLVVTLQKAAIVKMNYACFWRPDDLLRISGILEMMGMSSLSGIVGQRIAKGQHWMFSPWREITFVHAVPRPLAAPDAAGKKYPSIEQIMADRNYGDNFATLHTRCRVHGPSTGQLDIEAQWTEWVDDVTQPQAETFPIKAKVFHFTALYQVFEYVFGEVVKNNPFPGIQHLFNDTKHRVVNYKCIATTRYREYFFNLIAQKGDAFKLTTEGNELNNIIIPSSARPAAPQVEYVIPTFEWDRSNQGNKMISVRASGIRVYMKRPWYSSGQGEQLAVVLRQNAPGLPTLAAPAFPSFPVTTWGNDPTKLSPPLPGGVWIHQNHFINVKAENKAAGLSVAEDPTGRADIVAYDIKYDKERRLYFADIMLNTLTTYYPFIRLALARYQKHSVRKNSSDCCLSAIVQADYLQIPAARAGSLEFGVTKNIVKAALSGFVPNLPRMADLKIKIEFIVEPIEVATSEGTHISILAKPIATHSYILTANDIKNNLFAYQFSFTLPAVYASQPYRIKVMEYELITYDPMKPDSKTVGSTIGSRPMKERLVFAEVYEVNK